MAFASPSLTAALELTVDANAPLTFDYPDLPDTGAICIGLSFDVGHQTTLYAYALKHTQPDEHARAARFLRREDSLRHLLGRAMLRRIATHYGGADPTQTIQTNPWGKPELAGCTVGCNISHAGTQVWVALSRFQRIGIDIERANAVHDVRDITSAFHPEEIAALNEIADKRTAVMRCWSRKEAVSKATGMGLSLPLHAYAVDCDARSSGWLRLAPLNTARDAWTTLDLSVGPDYVGALAVEGRCSQVTVLKLGLM